LVIFLVLSTSLSAPRPASDALAANVREEEEEQESSSVWGLKVPEWMKKLTGK
jgi:hypothetical protein